MKFQLKAASGPRIGQKFPLGEKILIGSAPDAHLQLEALMEQHARILYDGQTLILEPLGEVQVNGQPAQRQALQSGDELRLGPHRFVLQAPGLRPASVLPQAPAAAARRRPIWPWLLPVAAALGAALWYGRGVLGS